MKDCPVCLTNTLISVDLETHLAASQCSSCDGHWVDANSYHVWLQSKPEVSVTTSTVAVAVKDNLKASFCPHCTKLMRKTKVGHDLTFYLDQCSFCQGIWFDQHEWADLKSRNLHTQVHQMSSPAWQRSSRQQRFRQAVTQAYASKFSSNDYSEAQRIKEWLERHPQKQELLSFFTAPA
ncbi:MAG: zf-TFIIB domain-containing protein [Thermosynechococcaceae cyanobacterium]